MSKKNAAIAAAEALGGLLCWTLGSAVGFNITTCQTWPVMAGLLIGCVALQSGGLWLFTSARYRSGKWVGYWQGRRDEAREHTEFMMKVFAMTAPPKRPEPPPAEKAN